MDDTYNTVILVIFAIAFIVADKKRAINLFKQHLILVKTEDGNQYLVKNGKFQNQAANMLNRVNTRVINLLSTICTPTDLECTGQVALDARILMHRLKYKKIQWVQNMPGPNDPVALNYNKGDSIHLCLFDSDGRPVSEDVLFTVVVHELAHIMEPALSKMLNGHSVHSKRFKSNENYIMNRASELGYVPHGGAIGSAYCGIHIPDPAFIS
jgi:hypothetical protein